MSALIRVRTGANVSHWASRKCRTLAFAQTDGLAANASTRTLSPHAVDLVILRPITGQFMLTTITSIKTGTLFVLSPSLNDIYLVV